MMVKLLPAPKTAQAHIFAHLLEYNASLPELKKRPSVSEIAQEQDIADDGAAATLRDAERQFRKYQR